MSVLEWARDYVRHGWYVFPVHGIDANGACTCGKGHDEAAGDRDKGKHPVLRNGVKGASLDPAKLEEWWGEGSEGKGDWNIGIRTGELSGITVLDVDVAEGKLGGETWAALTAEKGEPDTLMATTGSGGVHAFFAYNSALNTSSNTLGPGVDCRNDGGYVVAAPSRHRSGGTYTWVNWASFDEPRAEGGLGGHLPPLPAHLSKRVETRGRKKGGGFRNKKYTLEQVREMLAHVAADDRDLWRAVGIILGREFSQLDEAWAIYVEWSDGWSGAKGRNHDEIMREAFYVLSTKPSGGAELSMGTLVGRAMEGGWNPDKGRMSIDKFIFFAPDNKFMYRTGQTFWLAEAVNALVGSVDDGAGNLIKASVWLQKNRAANAITKDPSFEEDYVEGHAVRQGSLVPEENSATINQYQSPTIELGDAKLAGPFLAHLRRLLPRVGDADQFLNYMAHRAQHPEQKPRFALLIAGEMGTGKDTAIEMCLPPIGHWNVANISPSALDGNFNAFASAALVRVNEAANLQDMSKWAFNEKMKVLIAGNPDKVTINPKYGHQYEMNMFCGVIITTNHLETGVYIPPGDRRYDVMVSATATEMGFKPWDDCSEDRFRMNYFDELWGWFLREGGSSHVAALLMERDLRGWSSQNGQRKTQAYEDVVVAGLTSEHWLLDAFETMGDPDVVRLDVVFEIVVNQNAIMQKGEFVKRIMPAMNRCGYWAVRNPTAKDGRWSIDPGSKTVVFARNGLKFADVSKRIPTLKKKF